MPSIGSQKALASLVVHVGLDSVQMTQGLDAMKNTVRAATGEWKAQFAILSQLGDHVGAAKAKYDGLTVSIEAQKKVIDEQQKQLQTMGQRTQENAAQYDKLATQINKNAQSVASLTAQQQKAKQAYDYELTGIRDNKNELSLLQRQMQATVSMYQAQGKEQDANKAKAQGLTDQINKLTEIQTKEQGVLAKIAAESGKDSAAYTEQKIRLNELATTLAHTQAEYDNLGKSSVTFADRLGKIKDSANQVKGAFAGSFLGTVSAGLATAAFGKITSGTKSVIAAGTEEDKTLAGIQFQWTNLTHSAGQAADLTKVIDEMHMKTNYSLGTVSALSKTMFALTKNKQGMQDLAMSIMEVGRAKGLDDSQLLNISKRLQQVGVNGRITYADVAKMTKTLPGFSAAMAQEMGVSQAQLVQLGKQGKLTGKDFQDTMLAMGKSNAQAVDAYNKTGAGLQASMKNTWASLAGDIMKPITTTNKQGLTDLTKTLQSPQIKDAATGLGVAISKAMSMASVELSRIVSYINAHQKQINDDFNAVKGAVQTMWKVAQPMLDWLLAHPKTFTALSVGLIGWKTGLLPIPKLIGDVTGSIQYLAKEGTLGNKAITGLGNGLKTAGKASFTGVSKSIVAIGSAAKTSAVFLGNMTVSLVKYLANQAKILAMATAQKAVALATNAWTLAQKALNLAMNANPFVKIATLVIALAGAAVYAYNHFKTFRDVVNAVWAFVRGAFQTSVNFCIKIFQGMSNTFSAIWALIVKGFKNDISYIQNIFTIFSDFFSGNWGKLWKDVKNIAGAGWAIISNTFKGGFNLLDNLTGGTLGRMWNSVSSIGNRIIGFFRNLPYAMADGVSRGAKALGNAGIYIGNTLIDGVESVINGVIDGIDWILSKISMPRISSLHMGRIPYFANGTVDNMGRFVQDSVVHVGDGGKPELIKHADGTIEKTPAKDTIVVVRKGDSILGGDKTEQLLKSGLFKFSLGTWLGSAVDFIKGGWSALTSSADAVWSALSNPKQLLGTVVNQFAGSALGGLSGLAGQMAAGVVKTVINGAGKWLSNQFGNMGNPGGAGVQRWQPYVIRALQMNGLSTSADMVNKVLRQIQTESGGNPGVTQHGYTDINTLTGNLAKGLMQVIPPTFNQYKFPGHNNILNGFDNLLAALNYAKHRYGNSLYFLGQGHGYANGGLVTTDQLARIGENNNPEMIIPLTDQNRSIQLMYQALDILSAKQGKSSPSAQPNSGNNDLITQLITLQQQNNALTQTLIQVLTAKQFNVDGKQLANNIEPYITQAQANAKTRQNRAYGII